MMGQETRNKLTDYWKGSGVKEKRRFPIANKYYTPGMDRPYSEKA